MPRKYEVIDELIRDELREFLLWMEAEKKIELCKGDYWSFHNFSEERTLHYYPIDKALEDLINGYMEIK